MITVGGEGELPEGVDLGERVVELPEGAEVQFTRAWRGSGIGNRRW